MNYLKEANIEDVQKEYEFITQLPEDENGFTNKRNNTIKELMERKSVRAFTDQNITEEQREAILLAAMAAPTAGKQQMYTIIDMQHPVSI